MPEFKRQLHYIYMIQLVSQNKVVYHVLDYICPIAMDTVIFHLNTNNRKLKNVSQKAKYLKHNLQDATHMCSGKVRKGVVLIVQNETEDQRIES